MLQGRSSSYASCAAVIAWSPLPESFYHLAPVLGLGSSPLPNLPVYYIRPVRARSTLCIRSWVGYQFLLTKKIALLETTPLFWHEYER